ncbi:hypothetical protein AwPolaro_06790 [Polaromonas sp.]|nr:hypothetical protein AwPolaro_06790 [Polaromonas sp.]
MTPTLAKYISENFSVATQAELGNGFSATVWRGSAGTDYAGKLFISMRGTESLVDWGGNFDLAVNGIPRQQLADMVNWWLRETGADGVSVRQIQSATSTEPGMYAAFEEASTTAIGTGRIRAEDLVNGVEVDGHSLGGYLASAFTYLFKAQANVTHTSTFNSAGFTLGSEAKLLQLQNLVGPEYGLGRFPNASEQTNYFAVNGLNVATNDFWFGQQGQRVEISNELDITQLGNHYMYKLTDVLALGAAMEKLDTSLTMATLNTLLKAGSNETAGSIEGLFDSLRKALQGPGILPTPIGDADDALSRKDYQESLSALQDGNAFKSLEGKLTITLASADLRAAARNSFAALVALQDLSPVVISGKDAAADALLATNWQSSRAADYAAWQSDKSAASRQTAKYLFDSKKLATNNAYWEIAA